MKGARSSALKLIARKTGSIVPIKGFRLLPGIGFTGGSMVESSP
jgi:hypothetical protein